MILEIQRHRADQVLITPEGEVTRRPPGFGGGASRDLQSMEESVAQERARACKTVPGGRIDAGQAVENTDGGLQRVSVLQSTASSPPLRNGRDAWTSDLAATAGSAGNSVSETIAARALRPSTAVNDDALSTQRATADQLVIIRALTAILRRIRRFRPGEPP